MTPEEAVRSYVYHPPAEELPDPAPPHDFGRIERRAAVALALLAVLAIGFGIGMALP